MHKCMHLMKIVRGIGQLLRCFETHTTANSSAGPETVLVLCIEFFFVVVVVVVKLISGVPVFQGGIIWKRGL